MKKPTILLAEDDKNLGFVIRDHLVQEGYEVAHAVNGLEAWKEFGQQAFDLCLIDVMMPKMDGFSLSSRIRQQDEFVPILFLTAKSLEEDRLRGFEVGGDDYIAKPFSMKELLYRINVFLRRRIYPPAEAALRKIGAVTFDTRNLILNAGEEEIQLTQMEADLLLMLHANENRLVRREDILVKIWGENDYFKGRSLDVFISRLRKYLKADPDLEIRNHHGVGFTLVNDHFSG